MSETDTRCRVCGEYHANGACETPRQESSFAPATCSEFRPKDQQWLQEMCELVKNKIPDTHTFVVFAFPVHTTDRCYYASNAERSSAIDALKEWLAYQDNVDKWMLHDDAGPPPPPPWPKT